MLQEHEIICAGFGGQGVVLAGVLLGEAGVMDGKHVSGSNSYGVQARGAACKSEMVRVSRWHPEQLTSTCFPVNVNDTWLWSKSP